jgi:hypothetical protein
MVETAVFGWLSPEWVAIEFDLNFFLDTVRILFISLFYNVIMVDF